MEKLSSKEKEEKRQTKLSSLIKSISILMKEVIEDNKNEPKSKV
jgi:hypothetical protein